MKFSFAFIRRWASAFYTSYPALLEGIIALGDVVQALIQTVIVSFGVLIILAMLLVVEHHGVYDGLLWFMANQQQMAWLGAAALVLANLVIEFQIAYIEHGEGWKSPPRQQFSMRQVADRARYFLGRGGDSRWKVRLLSPAQRFIALRVSISVAIFVLALAGRMKFAITEASMDGDEVIAFSTGIDRLINQSSLADLVTWVGGTIFTLTALVAAQGITHYVAVRVIEIREDMKKRLKTQKAAATRQRHQIQVASPTLPAALGAPARLANVDQGLQPIRVQVNGEWKRQCPQCGKIMSRQAWTDHTCNRTPSYFVGTPVSPDASPDVLPVDLDTPVSVT